MITGSVNIRQLQSLVDRLAAGYRRTKTERHALALEIAHACQELAERRVRVTKTAPDGTPWRPWASGYAATRRGGHSLLVDTKELLNSFQSGATPGGWVAKAWNEAPHAQHAQRDRPFIGIGPAEANAAEEAAQLWLERLLA